VKVRLGSLAVGALVCASAALLAAQPVSSRSNAYKETSFATDPLWQGFDNRTVGCTPRSFAFGWVPPTRSWPQGAIGGRLDRSTEYRAYYAKVLPAMKTLDDPLTASGTVRIDGTSRGGVMFGWFNSGASYDWRTPDFVGLRIDRLGRGPIAYAEYGTTNTFTESSKGYVFPARRLYSWTLEYLPAEGAFGAGLLRLTIGGVTLEAPFRPLHRADGAMFNRFGLLSLQVEGPSLSAYLTTLTVDGDAVDLRHDPGWEGSNNSLSGAQDCVLHDRYDFGYSPDGHHAGAAGEIGGLVWRSEKLRAYYADPIATVGLQDSLYAEGSIDLEAASADSDVLLGWFNSTLAKRADIPPNFVGADLGGPSEWGTRLFPVYHSAGPLSGSFAPLFNPLSFDRFADAPLLAPKHYVWRWWICYRPSTDAFGNGLLTVGLEDPGGRFPGAQSAIKVKKAAEDQGAVLDRFGIRSLEVGGHSVTFYLDDLRYTSGPGDSGPDDHCAPS
jgi:hypothetical protein